MQLNDLNQEYVSLKEATFVIPLRIETDDRMRNIITTLIYILKNFDTTVIVKEFDSKSIFRESVVPQIKQVLNENELKNLIHIFEQTEEYIFHRTRLINDMVVMCKTPIVINYDSDIILPKHVYKKSVDIILESDSVKVVYPYGFGNYQYQVYADDDQVSNFINSGFDFNSFTNTRVWDAKYGFCQFFDREEYIKLGMENENFISYGYEDDERYNRFEKLSNIKRIDEIIYHLEHKRTSNSWFTNPYIEDNKKLFEYLCEISSDQMLEYYSNQTYMKNRNTIQNG